MLGPNLRASSGVGLSESTAQMDADLDMPDDSDVGQHFFLCFRHGLHVLWDHI